MRFRNRREAGRELALGAPLDVLIVRKLGVPGHEEIAMGAIAPGGITVLSEPLILELGIPQRAVSEAIAREAKELARREALYREGRPLAELRDKTAILVDDGLATGSTMRAAATALRRSGARRIVIAVPVAAAQTCEELRALLSAAATTA